MIINSIAEKQDFLEQIKDISFQPIFILGDQRSGTTLLYKLLASTSEFNYISAYDVIEYHNIGSDFINSLESSKRNQIDSYLISKGIQNRGFDTVDVNSSLPEEYGFILKNNSQSSKTNKENKNILVEACQKIQYIRGEGKPILLKNPNDFSNMKFLSELFDNAKFIVILRDENDIARSKRHAAIHLFEKYNYYTGMLSNEYKEYYGSIFWRIVIKLYYSKFNIFLKSIFLKEIKQYRDEFDQSIKKINKQKYTIVHYEELCGDADKIIADIFEFLNITLTQEMNFSKEIIKK